MIPPACHVYSDEPDYASLAGALDNFYGIAVERPTKRERAYEQARTELPSKSPDAADTARGASHKE